MTGLDDLEARLGRLDLRLQSTGGHLSDERIAVIATGDDPTDAEAGHLAGCDACVELLIALGEGLEALAEEQPALGALMAEAPRPPAPRRVSRATVVALVLAAGAAAAAAAGYLIKAAGPDTPAGERRAPGVSAPPTDPAVAPPEPAATRRAELDPTRAPEVPILPADEVVGRDDVDLGAVAGRLATVLGRAWTPVIGRARPPVPPPVLPPPPALPPPPVEPAPIDSHATPAPRRTPRTRPALGALDGRDGPRPLERLPVDGPPRGFGHLQLNTRPPARVFIDGKPRGWTPIIDLRLAEGPHDVRLVFDSPLAAEPEQRFRVLIEPDRTWRMTRDNVRRERP